MQSSYNRDRSIGYLVNLTGRLFVRALEQRLPTGGPGPMPVFIALEDGRSLPQKVLARYAAVEQPTMANTLQRMERDGLIVRTPDPADGRSMLISLTPLGRERAKASLSAARTVSDLAMTAFTPAEQEQLLEMLHRLIALLEADVGAR